MLNESQVRTIYENTPAKYLPEPVGVGNSKYPVELKLECMKLFDNGMTAQQVANYINETSYERPYVTSKFNKSNVINFRAQRSLGVF